MIIPCGPDWRISTDPQNWIVERRRTKQNGDQVWDNVGYYGSLEGAARKVLAAGLLASDVEGVTEVLAQVQAAQDRIAHACTAAIARIERADRIREVIPTFE